MVFNIGILGCGAIANILVKNLQNKEIKIKLLFDRHKDRIDNLANSISHKVIKTMNIEDVYNANLDLAVECASQEVIKKFSENLIKSNKNLMILSVGALVDQKLYKSLLNLAKEKSKKIYIPSGAICGIDALKSASLANLDEVILTTSKKPKSIEQTSYLNRKNIDLDKISKRILIFSGPAKDAVVNFPKNTNVSAILSLCGIGVDKTKVNLYADPNIDRNIHEIQIKGEFGKITSKIENVPSPQNPKTSYLAALSAIKKLTEIVESLSIGT